MTDIQFYILLGTAAIAVVSLILSIILWMKFSRLMRGSNGASLETSLNKTLNKVDLIENTLVNVAETLARHDTRLSGSVRGIGLVRFNPFQGAGFGGNQSFAICLIDEHGDGIIISSLYARERMSVFTKAVKRMECELALTEEEQQALDIARQKLS